MKHVMLWIGVILLAGCAGQVSLESSPETGATPGVEAAADEARGEPAPMASPEPARAEPSQAGVSPTGTSMKAVFPHVRVDVREGVVEFDATVPIDAHDEQTPLVYLEVAACPPDTKEHETLVVTSARGRDIHAAMLMIGLKSGAPGQWDWTGPSLVTHPPTGDRVEVRAKWTEGETPRVARLASWVASKRDGKTLDADGGHFVFAGSRFVTRGGVERYEAEGAGTLIGITTFGGEMIAWSNLYHHDSGFEDPQWIANAKTIPARGTPVVIVITRGD